MNKFKKNVSGISIRYLILLFIGIFSFEIFYFVFTPLTIFPVYFLLNLFFNVSLVGKTLFFNSSFPIGLVGACISASAYYFLFVLNLATPNIKIKERIKILFYSFFIFLLVNILRIFLLSILYLSNSSFFNILHQIFWYFLSTIFVVGIWFFCVKIFKIKQIPFFTDIKFLFNLTKKKC